MEAELELQVSLAPFELHPDVPSAGADVSDHLQMSPAQLERTQSYLRGRMAEAGLSYAGNRRLIFNTHRALLLSEWARERAPAEEWALHRRLYQAYFADQGNLADADVLREACAKVGLAGDAAMRQMDDPRYERRLAEYGEMAQRFGITGVPAFVIDQRYKIVGAQPLEAMLGALRQIAAQER